MIYMVMELCLLCRRGMVGNGCVGRELLEFCDDFSELSGSARADISEIHTVDNIFGGHS